MGNIMMRECFPWSTTAAVVEDGSVSPQREVSPAAAPPEWPLRPQDSSPAKRSSGQVQDELDPAACCLCWALGAPEQLGVGLEADRLIAFHSEVGRIAQQFNLKLLEDDATSGLILGSGLSYPEMSAADTVVRMGQLLCRWAAEQTPGLALRVGVHIGLLEAMALRNSEGRRGYFGAACAGARALAESSVKDNAVHISQEVKSSLINLRLLRATRDPGSSCFYIDSFADVREASRSTSPQRRGAEIAMDLESGEETVARTKSIMPFADFKAQLESYSVDSSRFGQGDAKTLQEFYDAVVQDEKSYLVSVNGRLERVVELVSISVRIQGADRKLRELRIKSESTAAGGERQRNQPLAVVLHKADRGMWQRAVARCFERKFGLVEAQQSTLFDLESGTYSFESENSYSKTIPGILTTYKKHTVVIDVKYQAAIALKGMGLPSGADFLTGEGPSEQTWTWARLVDNREAELTAVLQKGGVDVSEFTWQAFADLYEEVYEKGMSSFETSKDGELLRTIRIVKVWLHAEILGLDHVLLLRAKKTGQNGQQEAEGGRALTMRMQVEQIWRESVTEVLFSRLGVAPEQQQEYLAVDQASYRTTEDIAFSSSYPGLKTSYIINEVHVSIKEPQNRRWRFLGLPGGNDFVFTRQNVANAKRKIIVTHWSWEPFDDWGTVGNLEEEEVSDGEMIVDENGQVIMTESKSKRSSQGAATRRSSSQVADSKVSPPQALQVREADELLLSKLMLGRRTDWQLARRAADRILDPTYTSQMFYQDVSRAFPELRLYCISRSDMERTTTGNSIGPAAPGKTVPLETTSGSRMSADDEYQRTVGALLAVFWLMRLHIDGKEGFCFGLDTNWKPKCSPKQHLDESDFKKRQDFYQLTDWDALQRLVIGAGLMEGPEGPHDKERTLALLVLMSMHDIMKLDVILPVVAKHVGTWNGYKAGETVLDHDAALSYVLEHCPQALPSYLGLSPRQQECIRFTHTKLDYNMGWLVQGEAPPGALFRSFRKVVIAGNASESDIAFYFVHWFADLAGAEPYPLKGCEKFVVKFPRKVLGCFIDSFSVVWTLGPSKTETQVYEDYVVWRWATHEPDLGPAPSGQGAIAKMRLVLMAQGDTRELLRTLAALPVEDRQVLETELAVTGCVGQGFQREEDSPSGFGPAILVYYGPALLQKAGKRDLRGALVAMAEVFRQAREMWPHSDKPEDVGRTVIVRIDALKDLQVSEFLYPEPGFGYVLMKSNSQEGLVKILPVVAYKNLDWCLHKSLELHEVKSRSRRSGLPKLGSYGQISERLISFRTPSKNSKLRQITT